MKTLIVIPIKAKEDILPRVRATSALLLVLALVLTVAIGPSALATPLQVNFDPMPTELAPHFSFVATSGRTVHYAMIGPVNGRPVLFLNGDPSNWSSIDLLAPYRSLLGQLNIRVIQPERVGQGVTPYIDCDAPYTDCMTPERYADDWADMMHSLGYRTYSVMAASQGGVYAHHFMKKYWSEVRSLHLTSALDTSGTREHCPFATSPLAFQGQYQFLFDDPSLLWLLLQPRDLETIDSIPGMRNWLEQTTAATPDDRGSSLDGWIECNFPVGNLSMVQTPVYIYHGIIDQLVPFAMAENHAAAYPNVIRFRKYPNDAHLSSLRHLGQTLLDIVTPNNGSARLICERSVNKTLIVTDAIADWLIARGRATEDICAWVGTPGE